MPSYSLTMLKSIAILAGVAAVQAGFPDSCPAAQSQLREDDTTIGSCPGDLDVIGGSLEAVYEGIRAPTGIAVDTDHNIFLTYARNMEEQDNVLTKATSFDNEVPWPSEDWQNCKPGQNVSECFVNVQNVVLDAVGTFWVLDSGVPHGASFPLTYGPKVMAFNASSGELFRTYIYPDELFDAKIQINDIRINNTLNYAFITEDSALGSISVLNLKTGEFHKRLYNTTFTNPAPNFVSTYNGQPIRNWSGTKSSYLDSGSNGIALASENVYWGVKSSNRYHFVSQQTMIYGSDEELKSQIQTLSFPSESAGFTADDKGRVYMMASQQNAILYVDTQQSEVTEEMNGVAPGGSGPVPVDNYVLKTQARSGLIQAADTAAILDGWLYFSTNQQGLAPLRQYNNVDKRRGPFRSYRTFIGRGPAI